MRNSLEINSPNNDIFSKKIKDYAISRYNLILNSRWHRVCFSPAINISNKDLDNILDMFVKTYKYALRTWYK